MFLATDKKKPLGIDVVGREKINNLNVTDLMDLY